MIKAITQEEADKVMVVVHQIQDELTNKENEIKKIKEEMIEIAKTSDSRVREAVGEEIYSKVNNPETNKILSDMLNSEMKEKSDKTKEELFDKIKGALVDIKVEFADMMEDAVFNSMVENDEGGGVKLCLDGDKPKPSEYSEKQQCDFCNCDVWVHNCGECASCEKASQDNVKNICLLCLKKKMDCGEEFPEPLKEIVEGYFD